MRSPVCEIERFTHQGTRGQAPGLSESHEPRLFLRFQRQDDRHDGALLFHYVLSPWSTAMLDPSWLRAAGAVWWFASV